MIIDYAYPEVNSALVLGFDDWGMAATDLLMQRQINVTAIDPEYRNVQNAELLGAFGANIQFEVENVDLEPFDLVVVTPSNSYPELVAQAKVQNIRVWSEVELAWQFSNRISPLIALAGDALSVAKILNTIFRAEGWEVLVGGPDFNPMSYVAATSERFDVVIGLFEPNQLEHTYEIAPTVSAVVGDLSPAAGRVYQNTDSVCIYDADLAGSAELVAQADVTEGALAIGFTKGTPAPGMVGIVEDLLVDRAYVDQPHESAAEIAQFNGKISTEVLLAITIALALAVDVATVARVLPQLMRDYPATD